MTYFTKDYIDFFKELAANNNKEWFDANKKRYAKGVKEPFEKFIGDLIAEVSKLNKEIAITHKDAIFRINRDIRFSKDKTPYKTNRSAIISPKGRKDKSYPGMYIEAGPQHVRIYGGVYMPDKDQLYNIRERMAENPKAFEKLINDPEFKAVFGEVRGEQNKIVPKEFKDAASDYPFILNKQWYWFKEMKPEILLKNDLLEQVTAVYKANQKLMDYFAEASK